MVAGREPRKTSVLEYGNLGHTKKGNKYFSMLEWTCLTLLEI